MSFWGLPHLVVQEDQPNSAIHALSQADLDAKAIAATLNLTEEQVRLC